MHIMLLANELLLPGVWGETVQAFSLPTPDCNGELGSNSFGHTHIARDALESALSVSRVMNLKGEGAGMSIK